MFKTAVGLSIFGTILISLGITLMYMLRSSDELTFETAKYLIFLFVLRIENRSSKVYLLFGGLILPFGKSRNIC